MKNGNGNWWWSNNPVNSLISLILIQGWAVGRKGATTAGSEATETKSANLGEINDFDNTTHAKV